MTLPTPPHFELKTTDLSGRIGMLKTKSGYFETPALLPVIHPVRQMVPCSEIRAMGYGAVMTNAYTTFRRLSARADEGIHRIIGFEGAVMTDSGGYQVLEFGSVDVTTTQMAQFEEKIGSDIAIILDKPTGLDVTKSFAQATVLETLRAAKETEKVLSRDDLIWTLPIQGGKYLELVAQSARESAKLNFGCYALGSPVEVMEGYDFPLLVNMILACKKHLPEDRPFHLFGAGHPLILPLAVALGCDMFDSASYMLYANQDRYLSDSGTVRLEKLEYLACPCKVCSSFRAKELKQLSSVDRRMALARHNLYELRKVIEETKQAIWEGRLWELVQANARNHPRALEAFRVAARQAADFFERGTPQFKDRGIFLHDSLDLRRPELQRYRDKLKRVTPRLKSCSALIIIPETKKKPFLTSEIYHQINALVPSKKALVTCLTRNFGLVPAELSDIFPVSQLTSSVEGFPVKDPIFQLPHWKRILMLVAGSKHAEEQDWLESERKLTGRKPKAKTVELSRSYKSFKRKLRALSVD